MTRQPDPRAHDAVGLCAVCAYAVLQASAKGSTFWRCARADEDPRLLRYPPLPVRSCDAHLRGKPRR